MLGCRYIGGGASGPEPCTMARTVKWAGKTHRQYRIESGAAAGIRSIVRHGTGKAPNGEGTERGRHGTGPARNRDGTERDGTERDGAVKSIKSPPKA